MGILKLENFTVKLLQFITGINIRKKMYEVLCKLIFLYAKVAIYTKISANLHTFPRTKLGSWKGPGFNCWFFVLTLDEGSLLREILDLMLCFSKLENTDNSLKQKIYFCYVL